MNKGYGEVQKIYEGHQEAVRRVVGVTVELKMEVEFVSYLVGYIDRQGDR